LASYWNSTDPSEYLTSMKTIQIPDAVTIGAGWDDLSGRNDANVDLLGAVYDASGRNLGYLQGSYNKSLFNNAIWHTGDDTGGGGDSRIKEYLGDNEGIVADLRALPYEVSVIVFAAHLVNGVPIKNGYVHLLPLMRPDQIEAQKVSGKARAIEDSDSEYEDSDSGDDYNNNSPYGTRGFEDSSSQDDDRHGSFVKLFESNLDYYPNFNQQRGFVAGKITRSSYDQTQWLFTPLRCVVTSDPQNGLWPALEYYARLPVDTSSSTSSGYGYQQPQGYQQQQQPPQNYQQAQGYQQPQNYQQAQGYQQPQAGYPYSTQQGGYSATYGAPPGYGAQHQSPYGGAPQQAANSGWGQQF